MDYVPKTIDSWILAARTLPRQQNYGKARPRKVLIPALKKAAGSSNWMMHAIGALRHPAEIRTIVNHYASTHPKVAFDNIKAYVDGYGAAHPGTQKMWHDAMKDAARWQPRHLPYAQ